MNQTFKNILQRFHIYHPLQAFYRGLLFTYNKNKNRLHYKRYRGKGFSCNVCHARYEKFVPSLPFAENSTAIEKYKVVAGYGDNIYCPNCMSTARERLIIAILSEADIDQKQFLHLSPEKNIYNFLRKKAHVVTADLLPGFYKTIDGQVQKQDATEFTFDTASFDWVVANHILEHIPDDITAMREIFRVLRPGGTAILQVPYTEMLESTIEDAVINDPAKQSLLFGQKDHVRIYSLVDYVNRLRNAGFEATVVPYAALGRFYALAIQQEECFIRVRKPVNA
jgi:SAM-dependent methyltransferase